MQFKLIATSLALISLAASKAVESAYYAENYAKIQTQRIEGYRGSHTLNEAQLSVLSRCLTAVENQDRSGAPDLRAAAEAAFGATEAAFILTGSYPLSDNPATVKRRALGRRARDCTCSTDDNYCSDARYCQWEAGDCKFNNGCGTLWLEECDGMCVKK